MVKKAGNLIREIFPHVYLLSAGWDAVEKGEQIEEGSAYSFLACMLFTAFALEAYLNEVGNEKVDCWKEIERYKSPKDKLSLLCKLENYKPDLSKRPFQTFINAFKFRDLVVHAKPEKIERKEIKFAESGRPILPDSQWLERCTVTNAKIYIEDAEQIVKLLHQELDVKTIPFLSAERTTWWRSNVDLENDAD